MGGWHAKYLTKSDVFELAGIYDIKEERRALAESQGIHAYATREELLADPRIELVTVATPNDTHEEIVISALRAGKNVICEKPVTITPDSLERMIAVAEECGKLFTVHQNRRFDTDFLVMKEIYDSGELGEFINVESRVHGSRGIPGDWRNKKEHGGGMLYDWGIHLIDQALMMLGWDVDSVYCRVDNITNAEVDDGFHLDIVTKSGKRAFIEVGTYNFISLPRWYMRAELGSALVQGWKDEAEIVRCTNLHEGDAKPVVTAAGLTKTMAPRTNASTENCRKPQPAADVHDFYRNMHAAIDGKATQLVTHEQMRIDLRVIMCAFESAESGKIVKF